MSVGSTTRRDDEVDRHAQIDQHQTEDCACKLTAASNLVTVASASTSRQGTSDRLGHLLLTRIVGDRGIDPRGQAVVSTPGHNHASLRRLDLLILA